MNVCFSLLVGLTVCQADGTEPATARVDEPNRIVQTTTETCSPTTTDTCMSQGGYRQLMPDGTVAYPCNECEECDDDDYDDPRDGGFCHCYCRSTCDMPQHYPYPPKYHGYYYFLPYNYSMVLRDIEAVKALNGDPRMPYATAMFESIYSEGVYEEAAGFNRVPVPYPTVSKTLPDVQSLLND